MNNIDIYNYDIKTCPQQIQNESVSCIVTSPPYWNLRNYQDTNQIGLESKPEDYVNNIANVMDWCYQLLRNDGTLWLNIGDTYAHGKKSDSDYKLKPKDLVGIPWRVAFEMQKRGWYLRCDIIWNKPSVLPESVKDRPSRCFEYIFLFSKAQKYYYNIDAIREPHAESTIKAVGRGKSSGKYSELDYLAPGMVKQTINKPKETVVYEDPEEAIKQGLTELSAGGRNKRNVWNISHKYIQTDIYATGSKRDSHIAPFPPEIPEIAILAGSSPGDIIMDPFAGSGTSLIVAARLGRNSIGVEVNEEYCDLMRKRLEDDSPLFNRVTIHKP